MMIKFRGHARARALVLSAVTAVVAPTSICGPASADEATDIREGEALATKVSQVALKGVNVCPGGREALVDKLDRFASEGNVSLFTDQLRYETNPFRQQTLKRLLIDEENRLGATEDRLRLVERKLSDGADFISRLKRLIAEMKSRDIDTFSAERTLRTFEEIQDLFVRIHDLSYDERERRRP